MIVHPGGFSGMNVYLNVLTLSSVPHRHDHTGVPCKGNPLKYSRKPKLKIGDKIDFDW